MCGRRITDVTCRVLAILLILSNIHGMALAAGAYDNHCPSISSPSSNHNADDAVGRACCSGMACCPSLTLVDVLVVPDRLKITVFVAVEHPIRFLFPQPDYPPPKLLV